MLNASIETVVLSDLDASTGGEGLFSFTQSFPGYACYGEGIAVIVRTKRQGSSEHGIHPNAIFWRERLERYNDRKWH
jgi:hypothetical protein